jgi:hypothetical protein
MGQRYGHEECNLIPQALKEAIPSLKTIPSYLPQVVTCIMFVRETTFPATTCKIKVVMYTTRIATIRKNCASPNVYERKPWRKGIVLHEPSHSSNM